MIRRVAVTSSMLLGAAAIAVCIAMLVVYQLAQSRMDTLERVRTANENLLFTVSHLLERTLRNADLSLQHTAQLLSKSEDVSPNGGLPDSVLFRGEIQDGVGMELVLDSDGVVIRSSRPLSDSQRAFSDRDYFVAHQGSSTAGLFVGHPFLSRIDSQPSMAISRRWDRSDGSFGGVVVQTIKLNTLQALFSRLELGEDSGLSLFRDDGTIIVFFPYASRPASQSIADSPAFKRFRTDSKGSFTSAAGSGDGDKLYTFRALDGYPLMLSTMQGVDSILAAWRRNAVWLGGITLVFMLGCLLLAGLVERELRAHRVTSRRLQRTQQNLHTILESLPAMVAYWGDDLINRFSNQAHKKWFGLAPSQIHGKHLKDVIGTELFNLMKPHVDQALAGHTAMLEKPVTDASGKPGHVVATLVPDGPVGQVTGFFVLISDITERKAAEDRLLQEKERFRVTLEAISDAVITTDRDGFITYQNPAAAAMTGWSQEEAPGHALDDVVIVEDARQRRIHAATAIHKALVRRRAIQSDAEHVLISRSGQRNHIEDSAAPIFDGNAELVGAVMVFRDVSQARAMAHKMTHLAQHDPLTGIPNRRLLDRLLKQALGRAARNHDRVALLYLDLDGFKNVNDTLGHAAGDELLVQATRRFSEAVRAGDTVSRKGGDEFIVLMDGIDSKAEAAHLAARLIQSCQAPFVVAGMERTVTVSIGISVYPDDATDIDVLVARADQAMYRAKESGRNRYRFYLDP